MSANKTIASIISNKINADSKLRKLYLDFYKKADYFSIDKGEITEIKYSNLFLDEFMPSNPEVSGYVIAQFHCMLASKKAEMFAIAVAEPPQPNQFKDENNRILKTIAEPFTATFDGSVWGEDGWLEWDASHPLAPKPSVFNSVGWECSSYPLEVGYCSPLTLWRRMVECCGWVRWAYNSKFLYLFVIDPKELTRRSIFNESIEEDCEPIKFKQLSLFDL